MNWLVFACINIVAISIANLYQKIAMRNETSDPVVSAVVFQILTGTCYFFYALTQGFHVPPASFTTYFLSSMVLYAAGTIFFFSAIKKIEASEMSIIAGIGSVVTVIASMIFLKDVFTLTQLIGVVCVLSAVVLINLKKNALVINKGVWFALLGTVCYGTAVISDTVIIRGFEVASFLPVLSLGTTILMMAAYPKKISSILQSLTRVNINLLLYSLLYAVAAISFYLAVQTGALAGQVSTVTRASIIVTVILSSIYLKERKDVVKKIFGAIVTTVGVILLS